MSQLDIQINGRNYNIACDDGQEEHLQKLGKFFGDRVEELAAAMGQVGDARLMLMAGLMVADELSDAYAEVEKLKEDMITLQKNASQVTPDQGTMEIFANMTNRIEAIAARLEQPVET